MADRAELLKKYRDYYDNDIPAIHQGFLSRFKDTDVVTALPLQQFVSQNHIQPALDKRCSFIPVDGVTISVEDKEGKPLEDLDKWLRDWLEGPNFEDDIDFFGYMLEVVENNEKDGEVANKMILVDAIPKVRRMDDINLKIATNPENVYETTGYSTTWVQEQVDLEGNTSDVDVTETIDGAGYIMKTGDNVVTDSHSFGFIPVVLIKRKSQKDSPYGVSGIADLMEPQDNVNREATNIARANKYGPWGLYALKDPNAALPDGPITLAPGSLVAAPIEKVSGDGASNELFQERNEEVDHLYEAAGLSRDSANDIASASNGSGKAQIVLNSNGKRYVKKQLPRYKKMIKLICEYAMKMANKWPSGDNIVIVATFPSLDQEDRAVVISEATLMLTMGFEVEGFKALGKTEDEAKTIIRLQRDEQVSNPDPIGPLDDNGQPIKKTEEGEGKNESNEEQKTNQL